MKMQTKEWNEKYEAVKNKLKCKTALVAYFTENKIGKIAVDVLKIGEVSFPTGTIFSFLVKKTVCFT